MNRTDPIQVGDTMEVTAEVYLGQLNPDEVKVDLYYGPLKTVEKLVTSNTQQMAMKENRGDGNYLYACHLNCEASGRYGFTARVAPQGDDWIRFTPGLLTWAG